MSTVSTIPAAIDALVERANTVKASIEPTLASGETMQVVDSSARSDGSKTQLVIAYAAGSGSDGVTDTETTSGLRVDRDNEMYSIAGLVSTWHGDKDDFKTPRDLAYRVLDVFHDVIAADKTLGKVVISARLAEAPYVPTVSDKGPTVSVPFRIAIQARRAAQ